MSIVMRPVECKHCKCRMWKNLHEYTDKAPRWVCAGCGNEGR